MLKFLRRIRQKLIIEGNGRRYFFYAIGEIILVVLGILIAVQINTLNENRKDSILEREYLTRLREDINFDIKWIHDYILDRYERKVESLENGKANYQNKYVIKDTLQFLQDIGYGGVFGNASWNLSNNTYNELINTGNLRNIKNNKIRTEIINYYEYAHSIENSSKIYISGYVNFVNSITAFNTNNPGFISDFDQKLLLKLIKTEEYYRLANSELTLAHRISDWAKIIEDNAEKLMMSIDSQLDD